MNATTSGGFDEMRRELYKVDPKHGNIFKAGSEASQETVTNLIAFALQPLQYICFVILRIPFVRSNICGKYNQHLTRTMFQRASNHLQLFRGVQALHDRTKKAMASRVSYQPCIIFSLQFYVGKVGNGNDIYIKNRA